METPRSVHGFWFGSHPDDAVTARQCAALWWSKEPAIDREMQRRFEGLVEAAARRELDAWSASPAGLLALILLTDQFPRNIYRGTAKAFAFDPLAQAWCFAGLMQEMDRTLRRIERVFFYLPLEHSESLEHQERAVRLFTDLVQEAPAEQRRLFEGYLAYALRHREIIARFGRFPHRNAILGRPSTPEEQAFLREPGSSF